MLLMLYLIAITAEAMTGALSAGRRDRSRTAEDLRTSQSHG